MPKNAKKRRLTSAEWEQITSLHEVQGESISTLAAKFEISETAMWKGLKKRGSVKGARSHLIGEAATDKIKEASDRSMDRIQKMKSDFESWNSVIARLSMNLVAHQAKTAGPESLPNYDLIKDSLLSLHTAAKILSTCREQIYKINRLDQLDQSVKEAPVVAVTEYSPEELQEIHKEAEQRRLMGEPDYVDATRVPDELLKDEQKQKD